MIHVEVPCMQGATDDGNSVAHCSAGLEHACVADFRRGCGPAGSHEAAERVVSSEAMQRRQEDGFLAKIASTLEIPTPGYPTVRRP